MKTALYLRVPPEGTTNEPPADDLVYVLHTFCETHALEALTPYIDEAPGEFGAWDRLLADLEAGAFQVLLTDRFARFVHDRARLTCLLEAISTHDIRVILLMQGLDSATDVGKNALQAMTQVLAAERDEK